MEKEHAQYALIFAMLFIQLSFLSAQEGAPEFKSLVELVPIGVIVLDQNGKPVLDLEKNNFSIFENGKKQEIIHFSIMGTAASDHEQNSETRGGATSINNIPNPSVVPSTGRIFLIVLGRNRHNTFNPIPAMIDFVSDQISPDDLTAIMAFNRTSSFTTNHESVGECLRRFDETHEEINKEIDSHSNILSDIYGDQSIPEPIQQKIDAIFEPVQGSLRLKTADGRIAKDPLADKIEWQFISESSFAGTQFGTDIRTFEKNELRMRTDLSFAGYMSRRVKTDQDLLNLYSAIEYLRYVRGEKHILFLSSEGLFFPRQDNEFSLARVASDARVRIHSLTTSGTELGSGLSADSNERAALSRIGSPYKANGNNLIPRGQVYIPGAMRSGSFSTVRALNSLEQLSLLTGGIPAIHRDAFEALEDLNRTTSSSYLLGFKPEGEFNGEFRDIEVRVDKKDTRVFSRSGYFASEKPKSYDQASFYTFARTAKAFNSQHLLKDIVFYCTLEDPRFEKDKTLVEAHFKLYPVEDMFNQQGEYYFGKLSFSAYILDQNSRIVEQFWHTLALEPGRKIYEEWLMRGVSWEQSFEAAEKIEHGSFRIIIYDPRSDKLGSKTIPFGK
jgi:VWFA-related protein